ncbi:MAG: leucine-rich repeat protein [Oscillospiraceae bacterium]|nr:leucine-rich repeat protein [Oscillospiraceae bacterium]
MFCPTCNESRPNEHLFCSRCGTKLIDPTPAKKGRILPPIIFMVALLMIGTAVFFLFPSPTASDSPWFSVVDGELFFDYSLYTGGPELTVPSTVDGQTVTTLSENCFYGCDRLTTVKLPNTLRHIGKNAFSDCTGLRGIKLPEGLETIGQQAFYGCSALEALYIPGSVNRIGSNALQSCPNLRHIFFVGTAAGFDSIYPQNIGPLTEIYSVSGPDARNYFPS